MREVIEVPGDQELSVQIKARDVCNVTVAPVTCIEERDDQVSWIRKIADVRRMIGELLDEPIAAAHRLHKVLVGRKKALEQPLADRELQLRANIASFESAERARIERERQELIEAQRRAEAERQAAIAEAQLAETEARLSRAVELEGQGKTAASDALLAQPLVVPVPPPAIPAAPLPVHRPAEGTSVRQVWDWEITDANLIPRVFLKVDDAKIGATVRTMKGETDIPGVRAFPKDVLSVRGGA